MDSVFEGMVEETGATTRVAHRPRFPPSSGESQIWGFQTHIPMAHFQASIWLRLALNLPLGSDCSRKAARPPRWMAPWTRSSLTAVINTHVCQGRHLFPVTSSSCATRMAPHTSTSQRSCCSLAGHRVRVLGLAWLGLAFPKANLPKSAGRKGIREAAENPIIHGVPAPSICSTACLFCLCGLSATYPASTTLHGTLPDLPASLSVFSNTTPVGNTSRPAGPRSKAPTPYQGRGRGSKGPEKGKGKAGKDKGKDKGGQRERQGNWKRQGQRKKAKGKGKVRTKGKVPRTGIPMLTFPLTPLSKMRGPQQDLTKGRAKEIQKTRIT